MIGQDLPALAIRRPRHAPAPADPVTVPDFPA